MTNSSIIVNGIKKREMTSFTKTINTILFWIFLLNVIFVPDGTYNIKIISLACLLLINFPIFFSLNSKLDKVIFLFGFVLTSTTILWSILLTGDLSNISMGYPGYILLLYFVITRYDLPFKKILMSILNMLAGFIVLMALLDLLHIWDMYDNFILMWFSKTSNAMIGKGAHLAIYYMLFFKTTPFLFFALYEALTQKKYVLSVLHICAITLSGTRANIFLMLFFLCVYFCFLHRNSSTRIIAFLVILIAAIALVIDGRVIHFVLDMFERKASSDSTRAGHLQGMFEYWKHDPLKFIIGGGYSSQFYSYGTNVMTTNTELSYWNLVRQLGIVLFIPMMGMYLYPAVKLLSYKNDRAVVLPYFCYLVIAYTNPFLYSSTGIVVLLYLFYTLRIVNKRAAEKQALSGRVDTLS